MPLAPGFSENLSRYFPMLKIPLCIFLLKGLSFCEIQSDNDYYCKKLAFIDIFFCLQVIVLLNNKPIYF
jgi:hypothetical protein